jgi:hypothetical protein
MIESEQIRANDLAIQIALAEMVKPTTAASSPS